MSDYGVKGSRPGYDVGSAVDYLMQFNSSWPHLKVHETGTSSSTVSHNLGYPPFHFIASTYSAGAVDQFSSFEWGVTSTQLTRSAGSGSKRYFIFRLPLDQDYTAPDVDGGTIKTTDNDDYGFKLAKPGKDIDSTDMRDFALHSSTQSPMVHKVSHGPMTLAGGFGYYREVAHGLPYTPIAFAFIKPGTNSLGMPTNRYGVVNPPVGVSSFWYTVDDAVSGYGGSGKVLVWANDFDFSAASDVSVVILKEPLLKEEVTVNFP